MISGLLVSFVIAIVIIIAAHLTVDKDFSPTVKKWTVFVLLVLTILYIVFGLL